MTREEYHKKHRVYSDAMEGISRKKFKLKTKLALLEVAFEEVYERMLALEIEFRNQIENEENKENAI